MKKYTVAQLDAVEPTPCPCGTTRRAFVGEPGGPATIHLLKVEETARTHYHKKLTEIYIILEGEGVLELDDDRVPAAPDDHRHDQARLPPPRRRQPDADQRPDPRV